MITDHDGVQWRVKFIADGVFHYTDPAIIGWDYWDNTPWCDNGRWQLNDCQIKLSFDGGCIHYEGWVEPTKMHGLSRWPSSVGGKPLVHTWTAAPMRDQA